MDRLRARASGHIQDRVRAQVGLDRRRVPNVIRLVRFANVERGAVRIRIDGDGGDAQLAAGADDAHRNLSAVGNQDLLEHGAFRCRLYFPGVAGRFQTVSPGGRTDNSPAF